MPSAGGDPNVALNQLIETFFNSLANTDVRLGAEYRGATLGGGAQQPAVHDDRTPGDWRSRKIR